MEIGASFSRATWGKIATVMEGVGVGMNLYPFSKLYIKAITK